MMEESKLVFEAVKHDLADAMWRTRVPWGWLVMMSAEVMHQFPDGRFDSGWDWRTSITFMFDPFHRWKVGR